MSSAKRIGELSEAREGVDIEWKIFNFFSLSKQDSSYESPDFHAANSKWHLEIKPHGTATNNCIGYISFFAWRIDLEPPIIVDLELGIKSVEGVVERNLKTSWTADNEKCSWGWHRFIDRTELKLKRSKLVPSDTLTLTCKMKVKDAVSDTSTRLDMLSLNLKDMFISKKHCDVTMKVKGKMFSAHKSILSVRSPVFAAMFENDMSEKNTGVINIADCDPETFNDFLLYIYCGKVENCAKCDIYHLYEIADKYDVQHLKSLCVNYMMHNLCVENLCDTVVLGHQFNESKLMEKVQRFFNENFSKIVSSDSWITLMAKDCHLANHLLKTMAPKVKIDK